MIGQNHTWQSYLLMWCFLSIKKTSHEYLCFCLLSHDNSTIFSFCYDCTYLNLIVMLGLAIEGRVKYDGKQASWAAHAPSYSHEILFWIDLLRIDFRNLEKNNIYKFTVRDFKYQDLSCNYFMIISCITSWATTQSHSTTILDCVPHFSNKLFFPCCRVFFSSNLYIILILEPS